ncbi:MAG: cyclic pyranopterin phosphate synthase [Planctomycetota bacterium]|jgi:cyclic pyranopterin phosphate synthase
MANGQEENGFSHFDADGKVRMVDVGDKDITTRLARARGFVRMEKSTLSAIRDGKISKGAVLSTARLAGIMAAKKTSDLIPLCHPLALTKVEVDFEFLDDTTIEINSLAKVSGQTGVEMEALTACSVAALTIYDMCKAVDRGMEIASVSLMHKSGGKSGVFDREVNS